MRHIGNLPTHEQARRFADYLLVRDVKVNIDQEDGHWAIWAVEEDQTQQVKEELNRFREHPDADEYRGHGSTAQRRRKEEEKANREFRNKQIDVRTRWGRGAAGVKAGPVTKGLIFVSIVVAVITGLGSDRGTFFQSLLFESWAVVDGSLVPTGWQAILSGQFWRIFTPMFLHFDPFHILFNMYMLYHFGTQVESRIPTWKYLVLVLAMSACANIGQVAWNDVTQSHAPFGGMSGVVYGLFGFIWIKSIFEPQERYFMPQQTVIILGIWMLLGVFDVISHIANGAHVVGFISGCAFGYARTFYKSFLS